MALGSSRSRGSHLPPATAETQEKEEQNSCVERNRNQKWLLVWVLSWNMGALLPLGSLRHPELWEFISFPHWSYPKWVHAPEATSESKPHETKPQIFSDHHLLLVRDLPLGAEVKGLPTVHHLPELLPQLPKLPLSQLLFGLLWRFLGTFRVFSPVLLLGETGWVLSNRLGD